MNSLKMITNYKFIFPLFLMVLAGSCTDDFEEINTNPNFPETVTPELLMINILYQTADRMAGEGLEDGAGLAQYVTKWDFNDDERYVFSGKTSFWTELYFLIRDVDNMITFADDVENEAYKAVGYIMKAYLASSLTDLWGDVPFTEAIRAKTEGIFTAGYETQQEIYTNPNGILDLLKQADAILASTSNSISPSNDVYFGGNLNSWRKFANSLQLRYLLRISEVHPNASSEMQSLLDSKPVFESNDDNASLPYLASSPNQFPLFTVRDGDFNLKRMTNTIETALETLGDSRVDRWFQPADSAIEADGESSTYHGMPVGLLEQTRAQLGFTELNHVSKVGTMFREQPDAAEATLMSYSELQFVLAEAAHKGLISGGDAAANMYYEQGITSSFNFWGAEIPSDYLSRDGVAFGSGETLELILTQKWLANFLVGYEGWLDYRRTGYPALPDPMDNSNNGKVPSRFFYPNEEQLLNTDNWQAAVDRMGGSDDINYSVWWEVLDF